ncbi:M20 family metallopeptidase [Thermosphaera chiliense]|uniref:M20 family metallopeptidase n=1 Tax=Thermosphaera chiliense TaxID=3402707 RepID=A0A7M1UR97_9CREN|nr:M20 family metallopeptidase [Thermosphaera aggregans]QOR93973.1 M20 family metallopeptidase [Thermosphaera aggregans]
MDTALKHAFEISQRILINSVKYPTILGDSYEEIVNYYADELSKYGIHTTIHRVPREYCEKVLSRQFNPEKPRYILIARIGSGEKVLQFNGHYDVVAAGGGWLADPFNPVVTDGKVYGRGTTDMKAGIAAFLATMIYFATISKEPDIIVEGAVVPDEEIGGATGTGYLVNELGSRPDFAVIAEPSGPGNIYIGHRGNVWAMIRVRGKQAHGSTPWLGENAFEKMIVLADYIVRKYKPVLEAKKSSFKYEDPRASSPTITLGGKLEAPGSINIVPGQVGFSIDRRLIVEERADQVIEEIKGFIESASKELGVDSEVEIVEHSNPVYVEENHPYVNTLAQAVKETLGVEPSRTICVGGLDLKYYLAKGIPAVAYGPGEVNTAHKANEYVTLESLYNALRVYVKLVEFFK